MQDGDSFFWEASPEGAAFPFYFSRRFGSVLSHKEALGNTG